MPAPNGLIGGSQLRLGQMEILARFGAGGTEISVAGHFPLELMHMRRNTTVSTMRGIPV
jgi:hypothetical protein